MTSIRPGEPTAENVRRLDEQVWYVQRHGIVDEVVEDSPQGDRIRFRVKIWDDGRDAFITQWFNDPTPAYDFRDRIREENESYHEVRNNGQDEG